MSGSDADDGLVLVSELNDVWCGVVVVAVSVSVEGVHRL